MSIRIASAPCCWGVEDPNNPYNPKWEKVLDEASQVGYKGIELGPYGYMPLDTGVVKEALIKRNITIVAGTIFDDLVSEYNLDSLMKKTNDICKLLSSLPQVPKEERQHFSTPYLVLIDQIRKERSTLAGHPYKSPKLDKGDWKRMISHIKTISEISWEKYGVRSVIHPHAGGYIEFADEINQIVEDIPHGIAGLCLDTGHLYYSCMDPVEWLKSNASRLDYIHFKDINLKVYQDVINREVDFFQACAERVMCPIGKGIIDYDSIHRLLAEIDYHGWITIEQERDPRDSGTSLLEIKESLEYLKSVGY